MAFTRKAAAVAVTGLLWCLAPRAADAAPPAGQAPDVGDVAPAGEVAISRIHIAYDDLGGAGNRIDAFIVANADYAELDDLETPVSDAEIVGAALKSRGIGANTQVNINRKELERSLRTFSRKRNGDVFVFYYAGHAANINGQPSLIFPAFRVEGNTSNGEYLPISEITEIISKLGYGKVLIVFDACRNIIELDDASEETAEVVAKYAGTRGVNALAGRKVELGALEGLDFAISFSSAKGQVAIDTLNGRNSPYAEAFAANLREKETFFDAIIETRRGVRNATGNRQRPTLEMSWDEDISLSTGIVRSASITLLEPRSAILHASRDNIRSDEAFLAWDHTVVVSHQVQSPDDACAPQSSPPNSMTFRFHSLDCVTDAHGMRPVSGKADILETWQTDYRDGVTRACEEAVFEVDLDSDGRAERLRLGSNRYGGLLQFDRDGHSASYYSELGCNFTSMTVYDIDRNGIRDLLFEFHCEAGSCLVFLSGEKLVANVDGVFGPAGDEPIARFMKPSRWHGVLGGLSKIALFYDQNIRWTEQLAGNSLSYTTFSTTWQPYEEHVMPNKQVAINRDGSVVLESDGKVFALPSLQTRDIALRPAR